MAKTTLDLPGDTAAALEIAPEALAGELRLAAAMKLYEIGRSHPAPRPPSPASPSRLS